MMIPSVIPICDMACGIANVPAPTIVFSKLILLLIMEAWPPPALGLGPLLCLSGPHFVSIVAPSRGVASGRGEGTSSSLVAPCLVATVRSARLPS